MLSNLKQFFDSIRNFFAEGTPRNEAEHAIGELWLEKRNLYLARTMLVFGLFFHSTSMVIHPILVRDRFKLSLFSIHLFFFTANVLWVTILKKQSRIPLRQYILCLEVIATTVFAWICHAAYFSEISSLDEKIFAANSQIGIAVILAMVIPYHNWVLGTVASYYCLVSLASSFDGSHLPNPLWILLVLTLSATAFIFQKVLINRTRAAAIKELQLRQRLAPLQIVMKSLAEDIALDKLFEPKMRYCVCISSDWRDFQQLTSRLDAKTVASSLSDYYSVCNRELRALIPSGNYYTDWIADELFVVLFTDNPLAIMQLADAALVFTKTILMRKREVCRERAFPFAIDIGISIGQAMVGMMGPEDHKKATALGEVPGRSRRLQSAGKLLRHKQGEKDRVIFAKDFFDTLTSGEGIVTFALEESRSLRDLDSRELYFVEDREEFFDMVDVPPTAV